MIAGVRRPAWLSQAARFALVGVSNTLLDLAIFALLVHVGVPATVSNVISYSAGIAWSFFWNQRWTFREANGFRLAVAGKFLLVNLTGLALSTALVYAFTALLAPVAAKLATVPVIFVWGFALSKLFVFKPERAPVE